MTITLDQVDAKETTTSMAVTTNENDYRVTESSDEEEFNPGRNTTGSILAERLEEGIKDITDNEKSNKEKEDMSGRILIGSTVTGRLEGGGRRNEGGGGGGRRIRSLEAELKRNITGIKQVLRVYQ